ncbi:MAG: AAA family ATPase [Alphaproteobacteria bacterium GM7ARS4]|nr:AAA family ATPase [Alphaproteobacteria bacterium GM7ARS4]
MTIPLTSDHAPDTTLSVKQAFGIESNLTCPCFSKPHEHSPEIDERYCFDELTTLAILAGFMHNQRVMIQGFHGTGKSSHIEQVAARLRWPCVRVNLDSHISRIDLIGKDGIVLRDGKQVTEFQPGILTWALQHPVALVFDEYDAGRSDVMFVIQRVLESDGRLTLLDQNRVITPHRFFRLFATANTIGLGDSTGLYHGTQQINQGQMDRWHIVCLLNYLSIEQELKILLAKAPHYETEKGRALLRSMIEMAHLTREGFRAGDLSTLMSPRTLITWLSNIEIFSDKDMAFRLSFFNRCDEEERVLVAEYYQRCFDSELLAPMTPSTAEERHETITKSAKTSPPRKKRGTPSTPS